MTDLEELAGEVAAMVVDAFDHSHAAGLSREESTSLVLGALKGIMRSLSPDDCGRIARGAAMQFEMLAEGQPLPSQMPN